MRNSFVLGFAALVFSFSCGARAEDGLSLVHKAAKRSTLDQPGTYPFHLHATLAPSFERDKDSHRTGEIDIWWQAPGQYRRELRSPGFHQIEVVNGGQVWQSNEGEYMPDWLDGIAKAFLHPVPAESAAMHGIEPDKSRSMAGSLYLDWEKPLPMDMQPSKQDIAITETTGLLFYDGGLGWGALFKDYADFHGRQVPRSVSDGSPEVTAKVVLLEDLPSVPAGWFDVVAAGGDPHSIALVAVDKTDLSSDVAGQVPPLIWPEVTTTPVSGVIWTNLVLDRTGRIREPFQTISDNPAINGFMHDYLAGLQFKPVLVNGEPVQVIRHVVLHFNLKRPTGVEDLGTARDAFERGRRASALSISATGSYVLHAQVSLNVSTGKLMGSYTDTWQDAKHWRREAVLGDSRAIRSCDGDKQYLLVDGPQGRAAQLVLSVVEPIPAADTMTESDWRVDRDTLDGVETIRVLRGRVEPGMPVDPKLASVYWFDGSGRLIQAYSNKLALSYVGYKAALGSSAPQAIEVRVAPGGGIAMHIDVNDVMPLDPKTLGKNAFRVPGHEWTRQFTAETR